MTFLYTRQNALRTLSIGTLSRTEGSRVGGAVAFERGNARSDEEAWDIASSDLSPCVILGLFLT